MNSTIQDVPEKFLERLQRLYSEEELQTILQAMKTKSLPSFRTNTLKTTTAELKKSLVGQGFVLDLVPWYQDAFIVRNKTVRELTDTKGYKLGHIYIQNLSSMLPALALDPKPGDHVLDLCAAPGSKTTQMAALMENQGEIIANDLSHQRLYKLVANLKTSGVTNTKTLNLPGQSLWKKFPEYFDKTLVDVPCSMEGRICFADPDTYKDWKLGKIKDLATKQHHLLRSAISATKVGGIIVYSTCTLAPEENEAVLDWILKKMGDAIEIEKIAFSKLELKPGLLAWNKSFHSLVNLSSRVYPSETMEGFFMAKIKKLASTL